LRGHRRRKGSENEPRTKARRAATLCTRYHLDGVHGGRFTVTRDGPSLVWRFGTHTVFVVAGDRDR
jgi:hypothetical protein